MCANKSVTRLKSSRMYMPNEDNFSSSVHDGRVLFVLLRAVNRMFIVVVLSRFGLNKMSCTCFAISELHIDSCHKIILSNFIAIRFQTLPPST